VTVRRAALGDKNVSPVTDLWYFHGRNGQATMTSFGERTDSQHIIRDVPRASLDDDFVDTIDVLKLSVNGAEVETLFGARRLLSQQKICLVMMHVKKALMGRHDRGEVFAAEMLSALTGYDLLYFRERSREDQGRPKRLVKTAQDLNAIFDDNVRDNLNAKDYLFATPRETGVCHRWKMLMESIIIV